MGVIVSLGFSDLTTFESFEQNFDYLSDLTALYMYSAILYKDNYRAKRNFIVAVLIILDFDEGTTLAEAKIIFAQVRCLIVTTKTHQKSIKNGKAIVPRDKFRVIMIAKKYGSGDE